MKIYMLLGKKIIPTGCKPAVPGLTDTVVDDIQTGVVEVQNTLARVYPADSEKQSLAPVR